MTDPWFPCVTPDRTKTGQNWFSTAATDDAHCWLMTRGGRWDAVSFLSLSLSLSSHNDGVGGEGPNSADSCVGHFNVSLIVLAKSQDSVHKPQFFSRERRRPTFWHERRRQTFRLRHRSDNVTWLIFNSVTQFSPRIKLHTAFGVSPLVLAVRLQ